jgi:hypothetical protein
VTETVPEIGDFKQAREAPAKPPKPGVPLIDPDQGLGSQAISDFVAGKDISSMVPPETGKPTETGTTTPKPQAGRAPSTEEMLANAVEEIEQSPELTYDEKLVEHDLTKTQALEILDAMFTKGYFEKTYKLSGNIFVTFRTRRADDQDRLLQRIEAESPQFPATISNLVSKYNLAASLWTYKDESFEEMTFKLRYDYVSNLPDIVLRLLCVKLSRFDRMMLDVMDEGAIANF